MVFGFCPAGPKAQSLGFLHSQTILNSCQYEKKIYILNFILKYENITDIMVLVGISIVVISYSILLFFN